MVNQNSTHDSRMKSATLASERRIFTMELKGTAIRNHNSEVHINDVQVVAGGDAHDKEITLQIEPAVGREA